MSKQNYNKMSAKPKTAESEKIEKTSIDDSAQNTTVTSPEPPVIKKEVIGHVSNCEKLNIRSESSTDAEVLVIVNKGTKVEINEELSTDDFYSVIAYCPEEITVYGYAMKEYITIDE